MSILIRGMTMPTSCSRCPCCDDEVRFCRAKRKYFAMFGKPDWCPLVELPVEHGDLIDRDTLVKDLINGIKAGLHLNGYEEYPNINNMDDCVECVRYADTVIKAEGEE